jgi:hypothetical protein
MANLVTTLLGLLNFVPGWKTRIAAVAALLLAVVSAWNGAAPQLGLENAVLTIPEWANAIVLALLGVGAANQPNNLPKPNA